MSNPIQSSSSGHQRAAIAAGAAVLVASVIGPGRIGTVARVIAVPGALAMTSIYGASKMGAAQSSPHSPAMRDPRVAAAHNHMAARHIISAFRSRG